MPQTCGLGRSQVGRTHTADANRDLLIISSSANHRIKHLRSCKTKASVFCPRARCWPKAACSIAHGVLPCTPYTPCAFSAPRSYSAGALPGIDTQGSYNSDTRYSTSSSLSVNRSITFTHAQQSTALKSHSCFELYTCVRGIAT